jgi:hypothetical protein
VDTVTTPAASAALKALDYAENKLGVHLVYEDAIKQRDFLDKLITEISEARDKKRGLEASITDREFEIIGDERSKHADLSVAAMDKHLKQAFHADPSLQRLRTEHLAVVNDLDGLELDRSVLETDIRIAVARMTELGGYLQYLAVIKTQSTSTNNS